MTKWLLLCLLIPAVLSAATGNIRGIVHDPQHRPLPGAQIVLHGPNAGATKNVQSDNNGEFQINDVSEGNYTVDVSAQGFRQLEQQVTVAADKSPRPALSA